MKSGCLALFALPFAAVGVVMAVLIARTMFEAQAMTAWTETSARILETNLERHHGKKGSVSYKVTARYAYVVNGVEHEGARVGVHSSSDNIGTYHEDWYRILSQARSARRPVTCYVNPGDPAKAILDRKPRAGILAFYLLFATAFGGVGFGLLFAGLAGMRGETSEKALKATAPTEPWRWREEWNTGVLKASEGGAARGLIAAALFWNVLSWSAAVSVVMSAHRSAGTFVVGLFPLAGLLLAWLAFVAWRRWKRFGRTTLHLASTPILPGQPMLAGLKIPERLRAGMPVLLKLACVRTETHGTGKRRHTETIELWSQQATATGEDTKDRLGTLIPVRFEVPANQPEADPQQSGDRIIWRLTVTSELAGPDLNLTFELPVFYNSPPAPPA